MGSNRQRAPPRRIRGDTDTHISLIAKTPTPLASNFDEAAEAAGQNAGPPRSEAERGGSCERKNLACEAGDRHLVQ